MVYEFTFSSTFVVHLKTVILIVKTIKKKCSLYPWHKNIHNMNCVPKCNKEKNFICNGSHTPVPPVIETIKYYTENW